MRNIWIPHYILPSVAYSPTDLQVVGYLDHPHRVLYLRGETQVIIDTGATNPIIWRGRMSWRRDDGQQMLRQPDGVVHLLPHAPAGGVQSCAMGHSYLAWTSANGEVWRVRFPFDPTTQTPELVRWSASAEGLAYIRADGYPVDQDEAREAVPGMTRSVVLEDGTIIGEHPRGGVLVRRAGYQDLVVAAGTPTPWPRGAWNFQTGEAWRIALVWNGCDAIRELEPGDFIIAPPKVTIVSPVFPVVGTENTLTCWGALEEGSGSVETLRWVVRDANGEDVQEQSGPWPEYLSRITIGADDLEPGDYTVWLRAYGPGGEHTTGRTRQWTILPPEKPWPPEVTTGEAAYQGIRDVLTHHERTRDLGGVITAAVDDVMWTTATVWDQDRKRWNAVDTEWAKKSGQPLLWRILPVEPPPPDPPPVEVPDGLRVGVVIPTPGHATFTDEAWALALRDVGVQAVRYNLFYQRPYDSIRRQVDALLRVWPDFRQHLPIIDWSERGLGPYPDYPSLVADLTLFYDRLRAEYPFPFVELGNEPWLGGQMSAYMRTAIPLAQHILSGIGLDGRVLISCDTRDYANAQPRSGVDVQWLRDFMDDDARLVVALHPYPYPQRNAWTVEQGWQAIDPMLSNNECWISEWGVKLTSTDPGRLLTLGLNSLVESDVSHIWIYAHDGDHGLLHRPSGGPITPTATGLALKAWQEARVRSAVPLAMASFGGMLYTTVLPEEEAR